MAEMEIRHVVPGNTLFKKVGLAKKHTRGSKAEKRSGGRGGMQLRPPSLNGRTNAVCFVLKFSFCLSVLPLNILKNAGRGGTVAGRKNGD